MITATPVAFSLAGRMGVIDGLCTVAITRSPCGVVRAVSSPVFPADPGAPFGHKYTGCGSAARRIVALNQNNMVVRFIFCIILWTTYPFLLFNLTQLPFYRGVH